MCRDIETMKTSIFISLLFLSIVSVGQKSNLYQVFADEINQQTFIDKKATKIERIYFSFDTVTGKLIEKTKIFMEYFPDKKLCKTISPLRKKPFYWKTDTNGVNDFSYDKNGKRFKDASLDSVFFEDGKLKSIYGLFVFYDNSNRIAKITMDTIHTSLTRSFFFECYYIYSGNDIVKSNCYEFEYNGRFINRVDTLAKEVNTQNEYFAEKFKNNKKTIIAKKRFIKDNISVNETYVNGKLIEKEELYFK